MSEKNEEKNSEIAPTVAKANVVNQIRERVLTQDGWKVPGEIKKVSLEQQVAELRAQNLKLTRTVNNMNEHWEKLRNVSYNKLVDKNKGLEAESRQAAQDKDDNRKQIEALEDEKAQLMSSLEAQKSSGKAHSASKQPKTTKQ